MCGGIASVLFHCFILDGGSRSSVESASFSLEKSNHDPDGLPSRSRGYGYRCQDCTRRAAHTDNSKSERGLSNPKQHERRPSGVREVTALFLRYELGQVVLMFAGRFSSQIFELDPVVWYGRMDTP